MEWVGEQTRGIVYAGNNKEGIIGTCGVSIGVAVGKA